MAIFLLYPTFHIEFTIPRHDVYTYTYLLYVNSIQITWQGYGSASIGYQITLVAFDII